MRFGWVVVCVLASGAAAEPLRLTEAEALARAERDNPELGALRARLAAEQARSAAQRRATWPRLSGSVDAFRTDEPARVFGARLGRGAFAEPDFAVARLNDPDALSHLQTAVRVEAPVDAFGALRAATRASEAAAEAGAADLGEAVQDVRARVVEAYARAGLALSALQVAQSALGAARAREAELQARVETGTALRADLLRARTRRRQRESDLVQREVERDAAVAVLGRLLGLPSGEEVAPAVDRGVPEAAADPPETWTGRALSSRGLARAAALRATAAAEAEHAEDRAGRPSLGVYAQLQDDRGLSGGGGRSLTAGAALRWTPFDPTRSRRLAAVRAERQAAESAVRAATDQVRLEVSLAWRRLRAARERVQAAAGGAEEAREALRVVRERREAGMASLTDELEIESAQLEAEMEELRAATEARLAEAALRRAAGEL